MNTSPLYILFAILGVLGSYAGFIEMRLRSMMEQMQEKIKETNRVNEVIQTNLKENLIRIEEKVDMLIKMQLSTKE
jgi:hypothetical protein